MRLPLSMLFIGLVHVVSCTGPVRDLCEKVDACRKQLHADELPEFLACYVAHEAEMKATRDGACEVRQEKFQDLQTCVMTLTCEQMIDVKHSPCRDAYEAWKQEKKAGPCAGD